MSQEDNLNLYNGMSLDVDWLQENTFEDFAPKSKCGFLMKHKKPANTINRKFSEQIEKSIELLIQESNGPKIEMRRLYSEVDYRKWKEQKGLNFYYRKCHKSWRIFEYSRRFSRG